MIRSENTFVFKPIEGFFFLIITAISVGLLTTSYSAYAIVIPLVILFLFLISKKPQFGYYLIIFLIPLDIYRGLTESFRFLTISKFLGFWLFLIVLLYMLLKKRLPLNVKSSLWPLFIIFFVISLLSALLSDYHLTSFDTLRQLVIAYVFFLLSLIFISDKGFLKIFPIIIISSITISSILSIIGYIFNIETFVFNVEQLRRATGPAKSPNFFASMVIFSLPFAMYWFFSSKRLHNKIFALLTLAINLTAIILTYSRGGALVLSLVLVLLFIEHIKRFRPIYLGFITSTIALVAVMIFVFVPSSYWTRQTSVSSSDESVGARLSYLQVGWDTFKKDPLLGSGPGTYRDIYGSTIYAFQHYAGTDIDEPKGYKRYAHNTYLEVLVGTGIAGLIIFLVIFWMTLRNFSFAKKEFELHGEKNMASLVAAYRISFISVILYFFLISAPYHKYFWVSLALSQLSLRISKNLKEGYGEGTVINQ
jgi:putative inorganic carbon (hco3(-)) transporter